MTQNQQFSRWILTIRPKTLSISVAPVVVGCALAWQQTGWFDGSIALACLLGAMLIQIGTNLHNDAADFERGADTPDRVGPARATAQGWFTAQQVKQAALMSFLLAFLIGIYLAWVGGWPIIILGLLSLLAGYAYTGGPMPIAYSPSGELFVFLFFGVAAVTGTYYLQTAELSGLALLASSAIGLQAAAVLLVNNYRDLATDQLANKRTLAYYLGTEKTKLAYALFICIPFMLVPALYTEISLSWPMLLLIPYAVSLIKHFYQQPRGPIFNEILASTAKFQLSFSLLLSGSLVFT